MRRPLIDPDKADLMHDDADITPAAMGVILFLLVIIIFFYGPEIVYRRWILREENF